MFQIIILLKSIIILREIFRTKNGKILFTLYCYILIKISRDTETWLIINVSSVVNELLNNLFSSISCKKLFVVEHVDQFNFNFRNLCDMNSVGQLNSEQFSLAMYFIADKVSNSLIFPVCFNIILSIIYRYYNVETD